MAQNPKQNSKATTKGSKIKQKLFSIVLVFVALFITFSCLAPDKKIVGDIGFMLSSYSLEYIGFISYIYLVLLLYPLYKLNFAKLENIALNSFVLVVFFVVFLMFQSLMIDSSLSGKIGDMMVDYLASVIGYVGIWLIIVINFAVTYILFFGKYHDGAQMLKDIKKWFETTEKPNFAKATATPRHPPTPRQVARQTMKHTKPTKQAVIDDEVHAILDDSGDVPKIYLSSDIQKQSTPTPAPIPKPIVIVKELAENKELLANTIDQGKSATNDKFKLPKTEFFQKPSGQTTKIDETEIDKKVQHLLEKLAIFKIDGDVIRTYSGPLVTTFEFKPAASVKISKILGLQDDLAMALKAQTIRIQAPIPGKDVVGIEVPNDQSDIIYIRDLFESKLFKNSSSPLTLALGKDIVGNSFITDLKKLPHLLIAGTTGSGKSVGINAMIMSLLFKNSPASLRLIMIDPKMLEFSIYNDIPHLLTPVITKPAVAITVLANMVSEMESRYKLMANTKTKNIENYNTKIVKNGGEKLPYIVIVIDELADLMMTSGKDVEISIARLAQMARASGIHLIVATQRPSVDVITGLIKANLSSRISYKVGQKIDSKIILDCMGAEALLGRGDMLFTPPGSSTIVRLHAPWMTEEEIDTVVQFLKAQQEPNYDESIIQQEISIGAVSKGGGGGIDKDELYEQAKEVVLTDQKTSISYLQRKLKIGYNRAATIIDQLQTGQVLSAPNTKGIRTIL